MSFNICDCNWAGNLAADPKVFEPRKEGDATLFSFTVIQNFYERQQDGSYGDRPVGLSIELRVKSEARATALRKHLAKGALVHIHGDLDCRVVDGKHYWYVRASKVQLLPRQAARSSEAQQEEKRPAAEQRPDVFAPAKFRPLE